MERTTANENRKHSGFVLTAVTLIAILGLYAAYRYNYLLFHILAELFAIIIACGIFMVAWNSRRFIENHYLLFVGIAYLFVGGVDLTHTLTYEGMNVLLGLDANTPTQLWIAARYLESATLFVGTFMVHRHIRPGLVAFVYGGITALLLLFILYWHVFPVCFLEDSIGLTPFKIYSEYIISLILVIGGIRVYRLRSLFDSAVLRWLLASFILTITSELTFTTYVGVYDLSNMAGHLLKIASFFCIYKSVIVTGLSKPYDLMFRDLMQSKKVLQDSEARFKLLSDTAGRLLAAKKPRTIVNDLCRLVMRHLDCHVCFNFLIDDETGRLRLNTWIGVSSNETEKFERYENGTAICHAVAQSRQPIVEEDILNTPGARTELVASYGVQAYCCHPLIVEDKLIGTLSFGTRTRKYFKEDELEVMRIVTDQVALAIQRVKVQEALRNVNIELEEKVKSRTATLAELVDSLEAEIELRKAAERNLSIANQTLTVRAAQLRFLAGELTMAEQRERKRLSQVLHDGLQQCLAVAKLQLNGLIDRVEDKDVKESMTETEKVIFESIEISRSLSAQLSPPVLYEGGLLAGLEWLKRWMRDKHGLKIIIESEFTPQLPEDVKILVFESIRELLFNIVKHANVDNAYISITENREHDNRIVVSDRGIGFDPDSVDRADGCNRGFGLLSIRERIHLIGGKFEIDSSPKTGSRFTIVIPHDIIMEESDTEVAASNGTTATGEQKTAEKKMIRVLIVDDHSLFRDGITRVVDKEADMSVVGQACDGNEAIVLSKRLAPDVILMDISMPGLNGIEATKRIHNESPHIRIIALSMHEDEDQAQSMLDAGAISYKNKDCHGAALIEAIRNSCLSSHRMDCAT